MCCLCEGKTKDYERYRARIAALRAQVVDEPSFLEKASEADDLRFRDSPEWSEPPMASSVRQAIFRNPDPDEGLLLLFLTVWLDLQAPYTRVWTRMLAQGQAWLHEGAWTGAGDATLPRGSFRPTRVHLLKSIATLARDHGRRVSSWFATTVLRIAEGHPRGPGNVYRFADAVCRDLYDAKDGKFHLLVGEGTFPTNAAPTHYKRLWMLMMFLCRDSHVIRCLLRRALGTAPRGPDAFERWTDSRCFDPRECELPVDRRVKTAWEGLPFVAAGSRSVEAVAREARGLARRHSVAPASFDALLFVQ